MHDSRETSPERRPHQDKEYQDGHFHDDDDDVPADDTRSEPARRPANRKSPRKWPSRRYDYDD